ncbi:Imm30 family immunity protein [Flavobacterium sp. LS1R47]|uniref:Imm30 family immunity protein n=1 Tax=Flavobacterium frigoritolerans TaxID=2987686 RepID=A0A9X3C9I3_9FLAO|nr:Imm30 family immunity protein [Flavobacterium frigoritolerans]MCV9934090.1 Imm30 family immunity protein [Flavobacterium frigoritolerans]
MDTYESVALYEESVNNVFNEDNFNVIYLLIKGFHNNTKNTEIMYSNLHAIEYFSKSLGLEKHIQIILPLLKTLFPEAKGWAETFFLRLLNNEESFKILLVNLKRINTSDKVIIQMITRNLVNRNPDKFENKGKIILDLLK